MIIVQDKEITFSSEITDVHGHVYACLYKSAKEGQKVRWVWCSAHCLVGVSYLSMQSVTVENKELALSLKREEGVLEDLI